MISDERLRAELDRTLLETRLEGLGPRESGKVRDSYMQAGRRILVATDRISAFDCVLGTVPFKGQVLTQLAAFWFTRTAGFAPNHLLDQPDPNVMVVAECEQLPLELVVRGYLTGSTRTALWTHYASGQRRFGQTVLPDGLRENQRLERPILTPTTKRERHDRPISREDAIAEGLVEADVFDAAAELCFRLYAFGAREVAARGLILVDTKYEIGRRGGRLLVSDEMHTPDSSRYWYADTYAERFERGSVQRALDKDHVRAWYAARGFRGDGVPPPMPDDVRLEAARRYLRAYETITGLEFTATDEPAGARIERNLRLRGYLA